MESAVAERNTPDTSSRLATTASDTRRDRKKLHTIRSLLIPAVCDLQSTQAARPVSSAHGSALPGILAYGGTQIKRSVVETPPGVAWCDKRHCFCPPWARSLRGTAGPKIPISLDVGGDLGSHEVLPRGVAGADPRPHLLAGIGAKCRLVARQATDQTVDAEVFE